MLAPCLTAFAASAKQPTASELDRNLQRLGVVGNVLYVAAHPDDENTRLLAWLRNEKLLRVAYLSLTRGEGGQNLIGDELQPLLGVVRTQELLAARGVDGAEQLFSRARDFGFSKTPEETLRIWDRDAILADVVWAIRRFQPDVIITGFSPSQADTHGHHTASAQLALAAFKLAGDASYHPEWSPWQPKRIVWDHRFTYPGGKPTKEDLSDHLKLDSGGYNAVLGQSYGEIAATSRSMHKSQGFGARPDRAPPPDYLKFLDGAPMKDSIFDGIDFTWNRVPGAATVRDLVAKVHAEYNPRDPAASVPRLVELAHAIDTMPDSPWRSDKRIEVDDAIVACAGLFVDAVANSPRATPFSDVSVALTALNRSPLSLQLERVRVMTGPQVKTLQANASLKQGHPWKADAKAKAPGRLTNPYWLVDPPAPGHWTVSDQQLIGRAEEPPPLLAAFDLKVDGFALTVVRAVQYKWLDPVVGERVRPLAIVPPVVGNPSAKLLVFPDAQPRTLTLVVRSHEDKITGAIIPVVPPGWTVTPAEQPFSLVKANSLTEAVFHVEPPASGDDTSAVVGFKLRLKSSPSVTQPLYAMTTIEYAHIPIETIQPATEVKVVRLDVKRTKTRIGYIPGARDDVPAALRQVGYDVTMLDDEQLTHEPLNRFEAIVTGVRAFNVNPRLEPLHQRLMDYVAAGGTLVVQYNTRNWISKVPAQLGPWPFKVSQTRVTDENAAVEMAPHPILQKPNAIGPRDWVGWVQERGLYFADEFGDKYDAPLTMHDPGEKPARGALIVAKHGKGAFVYTGLGFFRQLPAGVPGAYRLLSNLLSYGH